MKEAEKNQLIDRVQEARRLAETLGGTIVDLPIVLVEFSVGGLHGDPATYKTRVAAVRARLKYIEGTPKAEHSIDFPTGLAGLTMVEALEVHRQQANALLFAERLKTIVPEGWSFMAKEIAGLEDWLRGDEE